MVVGVLRLTLVIAGARSLKDKRQALRKIIDRARARYNVSIAEVGENDIWQRAVVGVTLVANDRSFVNEVLDKVVRDVESLAVASLVNREMEIETYSDMQSDWQDKPLLDQELEQDFEEPYEQAEASAAKSTGGSDSKDSGESREGPEEFLREEDLT